MTNKSDSELLSGHRKRLRARLEGDPQSVTDAEVLELALCLAIPRKDTKTLAYALLKRFGTLRTVLDARADELEQVDGFGPAAASLWRLIREIMVRYALSPLKAKQTLSTPESVATLARLRLGNLSYEESWLALVDTQNRLISWEKLRQGSINSIAIQPRDVLELAIARKASGIILIHNHPGGNPHPSSADKDLTKAITELAPHLGLRLLDHIIITNDQCYSITQRKFISITEEN